MIFAKTIDLVLSGRKTQTCRLAYAGDALYGSHNVRVVRSDGSDGRPRWIVGHTYAVQRQRCHAASGRFVCTYLREVLDPTNVDLAFARAEGFDSVDDYLRVWHELHGKNPVQRCWAIGMKLWRDGHGSH